MRNRSLHEALRAFTEQAALTLDAETHAAAEVVLAEGFALARGDTLPEVPPEAVWGSAEDGVPNVLAVVAVEDPGIGAAVDRLRRLQTALRLFDEGSVGLGPAGWARTDAG